MAAMYLQRALRTSPNPPDHDAPSTANIPLLVQHLIERREWKKAEVVISRALRGNTGRLFPRPAEGSETSAAMMSSLLPARARVRLQTARIDEALHDLEQVRLLSPEAYAAALVQELLGDVYFARYELAPFGFADRQDLEQAYKTYNGILATYPDAPNIGWVTYQRGRILLLNNLVDEATAAFERAMLLPSHHAPLPAFCYERLAFIAFYEHRQPSHALDLINKATATYPTHEPRVWLAQAYTLRSRILREIPEVETALQTALHAVQIALTCGADGRAALADAHFNAGETAYLLPGHERDVVQQLGQFLSNSRRPPGIDVTWSRAYEMLGDVHSKLGQPQAAIHAYQMALQFNPYHPWELSLYTRISKAYYQLGDYRRAADAVEKLLRLAASEGETIEDYRVHRLLASAHYALGQYAQALDAYENALRYAPADSNAIESLRQYHAFAAQHVAQAANEARH